MLAVRLCLPIEQAPGHVVLSTFSHVVPETRRVRFAESDELLELTADHTGFTSLAGEPQAWDFRSRAPRSTPTKKRGIGWTTEELDA